MSHQIYPCNWIEECLCDGTLDLENKAGVFKKVPVVYLIHLMQPFHHARHYVGSTCHLQRRMTVYRRGLADASSFMKALYTRTIDWRLVRVWTFTEKTAALNWEYQFKKGADNKQHIKPISRCPLCQKRYREQAAQRMRMRKQCHEQ